LRGDVVSVGAIALSTEVASIFERPDPHALCVHEVYFKAQSCGRFRTNNSARIPIYYWIVRNKPTLSKKLRPFLEEFTAQLKSNLQLSRTHPDDADAELSLFYTMSRTTNDQASLEGRYKIFLKRLRAHH
jgi:hypothetical protein